MAEDEALTGERLVLHDLANPLAVAFGNVEVVLIKLGQDANTPREFILDRLNRAVKALERANKILSDRRATLQK